MDIIAIENLSIPEDLKTAMKDYRCLYASRYSKIDFQNLPKEFGNAQALAFIGIGLYRMYWNYGYGVDNADGEIVIRSILGEDED